MAQSKKDALTTLQAELAFVERGGYRAPEKAAWRPQFIFEDSPNCLNFRNFGERRPCSQCALIDFVPKGHKERQFPCAIFLWTITHTSSIFSIALPRRKKLTPLLRAGCGRPSLASSTNWPPNSFLRPE
jgi:hypothetical protein